MRALSSSLCSLGFGVALLLLSWSVQAQVGGTGTLGQRISHYQPSKWPSLRPLADKGATQRSGLTAREIPLRKEAIRRLAGSKKDL
jgi:hypothetical protein